MSTRSNLNYCDSQITLPIMVDRIFLRLTNRCNLNCSYCFTNSGEPLPDEMSNEDWLAVVKDINRAGIKDLRITGGEPFLAPSLWSILDAASNNFKRIVIATNGLFLRTNAVLHLASITGLHLWVTVHSLDFLKNKNFKQFLKSRDVRGALYAASAGIPVGCSICVHNNNMWHINQAIKILLEGGISRVRVIYPSPIGRNINKKIRALSFSEWIKLGEKLSRLEDQMPGKKILFENQYYHINSKNTQGSSISLEKLRCQMLQHPYITIDCNGDIFPCVLLTRSSNWCIGNIKKGHFVNKFVCTLYDEIIKLHKKNKIDREQRDCVAYKNAVGTDPRNPPEGYLTTCPLIYTSKRTIKVTTWG